MTQWELYRTYMFILILNFKDIDPNVLFQAFFGGGSPFMFSGGGGGGGGPRSSRNAGGFQFNFG